MQEDLAKVLLVCGVLASFLAYAAYMDYTLRQAIKRSAQKSALHTRHAMVEYVCACGTQAAPEHKALYSDLAARLKELPVE